MREPVANLSDPGVLLRLRRSVWMFGLSLAATALMAGLQVRPLWFVALAVPFYLAFHLSFQALFKT